MSLKKNFKILVVRLDLIGDFICTMPLFQAIKDCYPASELHVLTSQYTATFAKASPFVDKVLIYPKKKYSENKNFILYHQVKTICLVRREKYDLLLAPKANFNRRQGIISLLSGARLRIGRAPSVKKEKYQKFAEKCFDILLPPCETKHEVEMCLEFLKPLGKNISSVKYNLHLEIPADKICSIQNKLYKLCLSSPIFGYHISCKGQDRRWPLNNFKQLILFLLEKFPLSSHLITFLPEEEKKAKELERIAFKVRAIPTNDLMELGALAKQCDIFISPDGGPMHVAAATGTKTIGLFVNASLEIVNRWRPWGGNNLAIRGEGYISVEDVIKAIN